MIHQLKLKSVAPARALISAAAVALAGMAAADWSGVCADINVTPPYSPDFNVVEVHSDLFSVAVGTSGTEAYGNSPTTGGPPPICVDGPITLPSAGGFSFGTPATGGTISTRRRDANLAYTLGWLTDTLAPFTVFKFSSDGTIHTDDAHFGLGGYSYAYVGSSNRYIGLGQNVSINGQSANIGLIARVIGDAAQMTFTVQNTDTKVINFSLLSGGTPAMALDQGSTDPSNGRSTANIIQPYPEAGIANQFNPRGLGNFYIGYSKASNTRPLRNENKFLATNSNFPSRFDFRFGQSSGFGLTLETNPDTTIFPGADGSDLLIVADNATIMPGDAAGAVAMSLNLFGDATGTVLSNDILLGQFGSEIGAAVSWIQRIPVKSVPIGGQATATMYFHLAHTTGKYLDPYTVVMDMPATVSWGDPVNGNAYPATVPVAVWIDNQYAQLDKEITLQGVKMTINIPANSGLKLAPGETQIKTVGNIAPNAMTNANWNLVVDPAHPGSVPITVTIDSVPGPSKVLSTTIRVASSSEYVVNSGANLYTFPLQTNDTSIASAFQGPNIDPATGQLQELLPGRDFVAYTWDSALRTYTTTTTIQRGVGTWFVPSTSNLPTFTMKNATLPSDQTDGGLIVGLNPGWNLIGNPYNEPVNLASLTGVDEASPNQSQTWDQLVLQNSVNGALNTWDPVAGQYTSISGDSSLLEPGKGYWIFVSSAYPVRLVFPPMFQVGVPGVTGRATSTPSWTQSNNQWRLQLAATSTSGVDTNNYVGVTRDNKAVNTLNVMKPPMAPTDKSGRSIQSVELGIVDPTSKTPQTKMSQAFATNTGSHSWQVNLTSKTTGNVTVTWPNLASVPRNAKFTLKDNVTGETKDLRAVSGTTVNFAQAGTRSFTLSLNTSGSVRPVITNAVASRVGKALNGPVAVSYTLSDSAIVTVRILSATGKEVYTALSSRAVGAGLNSLTWTLRDNANRSVAPGTYQVEILAETTAGDRVRRTIPVNVIR